MSAKCSGKSFCDSFKKFCPLIITAPIKRNKFAPVATQFNFCPFCGFKLATKDKLEKLGIEFEKEDRRSQAVVLPSAIDMLNYLKGCPPAEGESAALAQIEAMRDWMRTREVLDV